MRLPEDGKRLPEEVQNRQTEVACCSTSYCSRLGVWIWLSSGTECAEGSTVDSDVNPLVGVRIEFGSSFGGEDLGSFSVVITRLRMECHLLQRWMEIFESWIYESLMTK